jgi:hypothetical protein
MKKYAGHSRLENFFFDNSTVEEMRQCISCNILKAVNKYVPQTVLHPMSQNGAPRKPAWMNRKLLIRIRKKKNHLSVIKQKGWRRLP